MEQSSSRSTRTRLQSQRGNIVVYVVIFMVGWFAFFVIKNWIFETKEARKQKEHRNEAHGPYQDDIYSNPYQRAE